MKTVAILSVMFVITSLMILFIVNFIIPASFQSLKNVIPTGLSIKSFLGIGYKDYASIKEVVQEPQYYVIEDVTISGILTYNSGEGYILKDIDSGYWVKIGNDTKGTTCLESQREYKYGSQVYLATGILKQQSPCYKKGGCSIEEYNLRFVCSSPLR